MKISIGADHCGIELRNHLIHSLEQSGRQVLDHGTKDDTSVDYPDFAQAVAQDVSSGRADFGVLICKTGIGMSISANKTKGIRAALVQHEEDARLSRSHNNANILALADSRTSKEKADKLLEIFLNTAFEGGRHARRVNKIEAQEGNI